jgi:hypothetical protein
MKIVACLLAATLALGLQGCWFRKTVMVPVPVPVPAPTPAPAPTTQEPTPKPAEQPAAPTEQPTASTEHPTMPAEQPTTPAENAPTPTRPRPPARDSQPKPVPAPPTQPPAPPPPSPQLGEILTDRHRNELESDLNQYLSRARAAVSRASGRPLTAAQKESVDRIKTFIQQAVEAQPKDLPSAVLLARRADLLSEELVKTLP